MRAVLPCLVMTLGTHVAHAQWRALSSVPTQPGPFALAVVGDHAVAIGQSCTQHYLQWRGAVLTPDGTWQPLPEPPLSPRRGALVAAVGDRVVVWGGSEAKGDGWVNDGASLDPVARTWRLLPACPLPPRQGAASAVRGDRLLLVSGVHTTYQRVGDEWRHDQQPRRDAAFYDSKADRWTRLPDLPAALVARRDAQLVWMGERAFFWGGAGGSITRVESCNDGAVLDFGARRWDLLPECAMVTGSHGTAAALGDSVLLFSRRGFGGLVTDGARFDAGKQQWRAVDGLPGEYGMGAPVSHAFADRLFVYSGNIGVQGSMQHAAWTWAAATGKWQALPLPSTFAPRECPGVLRDQRWCAVFGGDRRTGVSASHGPPIEQKDVGKTYGDGIACDLASGDLLAVPAGPLPPRAEAALALWRGGVLVVGGNRHEREWLLDAAVFALPK